MKKIFEKVLSGTSDSNIKFSDLKKLIQLLGFKERIKGDHFIYSKAGIIEIINVQPQRDGKAKPYQVKQVRNLILKYKLMLERSNG
ncbi:MAG: type II toxin-antitoxin system HicA family toxin [Bacteroidetes bacterium]|nr:type II toxin-antitoxin system HicA family toxin [Bacteroidota bacterium]